MKYLRLTCIFIFFACLAAVGQVNQIWYKKGKVLYAVPVAGIDSVTYGQFLSADTFLIVIDRASRRIVYDTVDVHVPGMVYHDTIHTTHTVHLKPGRRIGVFSVAKDKQVSFSQGNLQYVQNQNVWKFADQQYEYIGARNVKDGQLANKIDLFGWSGKDSKIPYGVGSSTKYTEYKGDFVDWGTNVINYESLNTWRTLSIDEWMYLYHGRKNADKLFAMGTINGVTGMILFPDDWQLPIGVTCKLPTENALLWDDNYNGGGYINTNTKIDYYQDNIYSLGQWQEMENAGAVFLPAAGFRESVNWSSESINPPSDFVGSYATSTLSDKSNYYFMRFIHREVRKYAHSLHRGRAVRLVHDTIVPKPSKRIGVFSVAKDKQVSFSQGNLQYVQNQNVWKFADQQYEYIGADNVKDGQLANKIDLFGWSANNTTAPFGVSASTKAADYAGDFVDWGVNEINGDAPNTWRTLSQEEWGYIFESRKNAKQLYSKGSIDGVRGMIVLPDDWVLPEGLHFTAAPDNLTMDLDINRYTRAEWEKMEEAGAVFLCPTGRRDGLNIGYLVEYGGYWSSSRAGNHVKHLYFNYQSLVFNTNYNSGDQSYGYNGRAVRLVHDTIVPKPSKRIGVFSVAKDRQVSFSQGNLQYIQSQDKWQFANTQYEYMGERHFRNGQLADTIEYFAWSAKNSNAPWGISLSIELSDYEGEFLDWGTNIISGDTPNTWRTLSNNELIYLCQTRKKASQLLGLGCIGSILGLIILPDDWVMPEGLQFTPNTNDASLNQYTKEQWEIMENEGAVFIPSSGYFNHKLDNMRAVNDNGYYRVSTLAEDGRQIYLIYGEDHIRYSYSGNNNGNLFYGFPVRLVHDTIVPPPTPCETFEVNGVKFNMMCVEGGTFMMGAGSDAHQVTLSDYYIGETEVTQSLWLAVMGGELPPRQEIIGGEYPVADITMEDCRRFVERLTELTGRHFRIPTEAEWEYAARGGKKSKGYKYSGSDDITEVAWYSGNFTEYRPQIVKQYKPNELGIYDMSGNVCEWVNDWYAPYNLYPQINPTGASIYSNSKLPYIHRGGCWTYAPAQCQPECRTSWSHKSANGIGLRIVMSDEEPFKMVYVNDTTRIVLRPVKGEKYNYYMGETEVTYALWKAVMGTVLGVEETDNKPVSRVSWDDCQKFIAKLNELTRLHFRLPTEVEWEYAARGGSRSNGYMFAGSNDIDSVGWYMINSDSTDHCVAQLMSNELGIYDMTGNVWEWCQDYYDVNQTMHVVKSGSWFDAATACRIDARTGRAANYKSFIGLRLVLDAHQYVDLGLSVKWATFNLGASAPEDYGDYFAWGEVEPKDIYSWATYKLCNGTSSSLTKYCSDSNYGNADYKTTLDPEDDAAYVNWGGNWRMPTEAEWIELRQKCTWKKTTVNGVTGYRVTAKNGNSIFLPRAGLRMNKVEYATDSVGYYASSTHIPNFKKEDYAYYMLMYNNAIERSNAVRYYGLTIRPVYDAPKVK